MAEKRKLRKRKEDGPVEKEDKASKDEYAIAKWLRRNVPTKKTKFLSHNVEYFTACKAVDALMDSHWAQSKDGALFSTRQNVVNMLDMMLRHKFFHRAKKVPVSEQELKAKLKKKEKEKKKDGEEKKKDDAESSHAEGDKKDEDRKDEKDKKKRKIRLEMHLEQIFVDGLDAYVWIYEPIPIYYWFFGSLLVIGSIAICLFPLWPSSFRKGVYYLSIAAAGFLVFIIALAILRVIIFSLVWVSTFGKHHLWIFPNLTEDVGFLASFWPLWKYEYKGGSSEDDKKSIKKKRKEKDSDNEEEREDEKFEEKEEPPERSPEGSEKEQDRSESESESSQKSQTGKDFEMVEKEEVES